MCKYDRIAYAYFSFRGYADGSNGLKFGSIGSTRNILAVPCCVLDETRFTFRDWPRFVPLRHAHAWNDRSSKTLERS